MLRITDRSGSETRTHGLNWALRLVILHNQLLLLLMRQLALHLNCMLHAHVITNSAGWHIGGLHSTVVEDLTITMNDCLRELHCILI